MRQLVLAVPTHSSEGCCYLQSGRVQGFSGYCASLLAKKDDEFKWNSQGMCFAVFTWVTSVRKHLKFTREHWKVVLEEILLFYPPPPHQEFMDHFSGSCRLQVRNHYTKVYLAGCKVGVKSSSLAFGMPLVFNP